jgi:hypothetical protein
MGLENNGIAATFEIAGAFARDVTLARNVHCWGRCEVLSAQVRVPALRAVTANAAMSRLVGVLRLAVGVRGRAGNLQSERYVPTDRQSPIVPIRVRIDEMAGTCPSGQARRNCSVSAMAPSITPASVATRRIVEVANSDSGLERRASSPSRIIRPIQTAAITCRQYQARVLCS